MLEKYLIQNVLPGPLCFSDLDNLTLNRLECVDLTEKFDEYTLDESESFKIAIRNFYIRRLSLKEYHDIIYPGMKNDIKDQII